MEGLTFYFTWEVMLIKWLQANLGTIGMKLMVFFTLCGDQLVCIATLCFLYYCWDKDLARFVGLNVLTANLFCCLVKSVVSRRRPYFDHKDIKCIRPPERQGDIYDFTLQGFSFPSGHSTNAVALFGSMGVYLKKWWLKIIAILLPIMIGISRISLGVHYPTDVLFGWIFGLLPILIIPWADRKITDKRKFYGLIILVCSVGWFYSEDARYYTFYGILLGFILAIEFEKRFVNFAPTKKVLPCIGRMVGGLVIFLMLNLLLELPFSREFLDSPTIAAFAVRSLRYTINIFATMGLYPMVFKKTKKASE